MVQPIDQGAIMRSGQLLVPDYAEQAARQQQMELQQSQNRILQQEQIFKQTQAQREIDEEDNYTNDLGAAIKSGRPQDIINLSLKYPKKSEGIKRGFDMQDQVVKDADLRQVATLYGFTTNGRADLAAASLEDRLTKSRAAGEPDDPQDVAILEALKSGDPEKIKEAQGLIGYQLAAITGVDNFSKTLGDLNPEAKKDPLQKKVEYFRSIGRDDLAESVLAQEDLVVIPQYGVIRGSDYAKGGGQPSVGGAAAPSAAVSPSIPATGQAIEQQAMSLVPGVIVTSRQRDPKKNAAVGGQPNSFHLTDQARDFVPPKGTSMGKLALTLKKGFPGFNVINEGDHVHIEPKTRGRTSGGPVKVKSKQQYDKLASGTQYTAPDGSQRVKP